jgi:hypothetical protein
MINRNVFKLRQLVLFLSAILGFFIFYLADISTAHAQISSSIKAAVIHSDANGGVTGQAGGQISDPGYPKKDNNGAVSCPGGEPNYYYPFTKNTAVHEDNGNQYYCLTDGSKYYQINYGGNVTAHLQADTTPSPDSSWTTPTSTGGRGQIKVFSEGFSNVGDKADLVIDSDPNPMSFCVGTSNDDQWDGVTYSIWCTYGSGSYITSHSRFAMVVQSGPCTVVNEITVVATGVGDCKIQFERIFDPTEDYPALFNVDGLWDSYGTVDFQIARYKIKNLNDFSPKSTTLVSQDIYGNTNSTTLNYNSLQLNPITYGDIPNFGSTYQTQLDDPNNPIKTITGAPHYLNDGDAITAMNNILWAQCPTGTYVVNNYIKPCNLDSTSLFTSLNKRISYAFDADRGNATPGEYQAGTQTLTASASAIDSVIDTPTAAESGIDIGNLADDIQLDVSGSLSATLQVNPKALHVTDFSNILSKYKDGNGYVNQTSIPDNSFGYTNGSTHTLRDTPTANSISYKYFLNSNVDLYVNPGKHFTDDLLPADLGKIGIDFGYSQLMVPCSQISGQWLGAYVCNTPIENAKGIFVGEYNAVPTGVGASNYVIYNDGLPVNDFWTDPDYSLTTFPNFISPKLLNLLPPADDITIGSQTPTQLALGDSGTITTDGNNGSETDVVVGVDNSTNCGFTPNTLNINTALNANASGTCNYTVVRTAPGKADASVIVPIDFAKGAVPTLPGQKLTIQFVPVTTCDNPDLVANNTDPCTKLLETPQLEDLSKTGGFDFVNAFDNPFYDPTAHPDSAAIYDTNSSVGFSLNGFGTYMDSAQLKLVGVPDYVNQRIKINVRNPDDGSHPNKNSPICDNFAWSLNNGQVPSPAPLWDTFIHADQGTGICKLDFTLSSDYYQLDSSQASVQHLQIPLSKNPLNVVDEQSHPINLTPIASVVYGANQSSAGEKLNISSNNSMQLVDFGSIPLKNALNNWQISYKIGSNYNFSYENPFQSHITVVNQINTDIQNLASSKINFKQAAGTYNVTLPAAQLQPIFDSETSGSVNANLTGVYGNLVTDPFSSLYKINSKDLQFSYQILPKPIQIDTPTAISLPSNLQITDFNHIESTPTGNKNYATGVNFTIPLASTFSSGILPVDSSSVGLAVSGATISANIATAANGYTLTHVTIDSATSISLTGTSAGNYQLNFAPIALSDQTLAPSAAQIPAQTPSQTPNQPTVPSKPLFPYSAGQKLVDITPTAGTVFATPASFAASNGFGTQGDIGSFTLDPAITTIDTSAVLSVKTTSISCATGAGAFSNTVTIINALGSCSLTLNLNSNSYDYSLVPNTINISVIPNSIISSGKQNYAVDTASLNTPVLIQNQLAKLTVNGGLNGAPGATTTLNIDTSTFPTGAIINSVYSNSPGFSATSAGSANRWSLTYTGANIISGTYYVSYSYPGNPSPAPLYFYFQITPPDPVVLTRSGG